MAARQNSSNGPDLTDVTQMLQSFEEMNQVRLTVTLGLTTTALSGELIGTALAYEREYVNGEARLLASASVRCSATRLQTLAAVVMHLLYMVDGKLAWQEMEKNKPAV